MVSWRQEITGRIRSGLRNDDTGGFGTFMMILFDQGKPVPLRHYLAGHTVDVVHERGWSNPSNGALLDAAERDGYQLLITTDQNIRHQQNLADRQIAIIVLLSTSWPRIRLRVDEVRVAVDAIGLGDYVEISI